MLTEGTPSIPGTEVDQKTEGVDTRRGVEIVKGGTVAEIKRPDGTVAEVHYTPDAEGGQETAWKHYQPKGDGKNATSMDGIQRHTKPILLNDGDPNNF